MTTTTECKEKRMVMAVTPSSVKVDRGWGASQELPAIPSATDVVGMVQRGDVSDLLDLRGVAVFYRALANGQRKQLDDLYENGGVVMSVLLGGSNE